MELYIKVPAEEAGRLLVSIMQDRLEIGLASGRMVSFEGASGDIAVKFLSEETVSFVPIPTKEAITNSEEVLPSSLLKSLLLYGWSPFCRIVPIETTFSFSIITWHAFVPFEQ